MSRSVVLAAAAAAALLVAVPAVALAADPTPTPAPTPTTSAAPTTAAPTTDAPAPLVDARICAALTTDGVALLRGQPAFAALNVDALVGGATPANISAARQALRCGEAPTGRGPAALTADVCLALNLPAAARLLEQTGVAAGDAATAIDGLREDLQCSDDDDDATPVPTTGAPAPTTPADDGGDQGDDDQGDSGSSGGGAVAVPAPVGAPETGAIG